MSIQDLGSIGEFVAAIATVATLVYLAVQIRQNTRALQAATFQQVVDSFADISRSLGDNRELAEIYVKVVRDPHSLNEVEQFRYHTSLVSFARRGENLHFQHEHGTLAPVAWSGIRESFLAAFRGPAARAWWQENRFRFNPRFREFVDDGLSRAGPAA